MVDQYQSPSVQSAGTGGSGATTPLFGAWTRRDVLVVVLLGLIGGAIAATVDEAHYWLHSYSPLKSLHTRQSLGLEAFLYTGLAGPLLATHAIFVGLWRRKPGMILATAVISAVPAVPIGLLLEHLSFGADLLSSIPSILVYHAAMLVGVAVFAEVLLLGVRATGIRNVAADALVGVAVAIGGTALLILEALLPMYEYSDPRSFGPLDWLIWLVLATIWAYLVSGLIPAAIAAALNRRRPTAAAVPGVTVPGTPPAAYGPGVPPAAPTMPAGVPLPEHPRAVTSLVLGVLGLVAFAPLAPVAWALASGARREIRTYPGRYNESGALTAGYVLGIIGTVLLIVGVLALLVFVLITLAAAYQAG